MVTNDETLRLQNESGLKMIRALTVELLAAGGERDRLLAEIADRESERADLRDRVEKAETALARLTNDDKCMVDGCDKGLHAFVKVNPETGKITHLEGLE